MKFKQYVQSLNKLLEENPEAADFDVVTSRDDEGNGFNLVAFPPSIGAYDAHENGFTEYVQPNAVCVN
jgi:hypothetical protein